MKTETAPYNPFDYIKTDEEINDFLREAYLDDNPEVFVIALGHLVKARGVSHVAKVSGLNRESLYRAINGKAMPRWDTVQSLMKALDIQMAPAQMH